MPTVYDRRGYVITTGAAARAAAVAWLTTHDLHPVDLGLPEVDDRYHLWRVPVLLPGQEDRAGEVALNALTGEVDADRSTSLEVLRTQLMEAETAPGAVPALPPIVPRARRGAYPKQPTAHLLVHGDVLRALDTLPVGSVDLAFTSPPYFNARPEYADWATYEEYLAHLGAVIAGVGRILGEGRFFVMNISPVLVRRENRTTASHRIAVPFDAHQLFLAAGFEFVDHIIWEKPAGAGWATGRGRRFAADRHPLQYKAVPVTEDVLVYRKATPRLIDWNIHTYPDQDAVAASRVPQDYERTNIWRIAPAHDKRHPAIFPDALAEKVIQYYSFVTDTVLDPYAGLGTTGRVAERMGRGFVMIERDQDYYAHMATGVLRGEWGGMLAAPVTRRCLTPGCTAPGCSA